MKFGGFYEMQHPRPWSEGSEHALFKNALEQVELSDRMGYDYVWATEHHFLEEYAHSSAPEIFLAACSQRTKNVRIGHGIVQMPPYINHPARVAERIATLDLISDGRCDFGSGAGATETELGGFNVPQSEKKDMFLEGMRIAIRMMVEQPFAGYKSKYLDVPQRNVMPKPLQKPHPPLWMACSRRESILQAARLGVGALTFSFVGPEQAQQWREDYYRAIEEESEPIGYAVNPQFAIACPFLCDKDAKRMEQIGMESYGFFVYGLGHYSFFGEHEPGRTDIWDEFKNRPREFAMPEGRIQDCVGTPDMLRARLREFEDVGIDQVVCISQAGKIPHELLCSSIELFSREVLPEFKDREQSSLRRQEERRNRISEKAMARKPEVDAPKEHIKIRAAGHH
ncbi:MAG TPA: LLM class flavin-dependent oxidoreductase [Bryobacteraceae bacterium]|jgi:alkanesulfonate monooxygenase SsuD/methylene tetrahydromethanopterin reductase-like flavin-dependent oxidoreductase (luciferase family)|nr:LLM class flavin-dependent oxidoreductase [Bryobacteraceae bacterium]